MTDVKIISFDTKLGNVPVKIEVYQDYVYDIFITHNKKKIPAPVWFYDYYDYQIMREIDEECEMAKAEARYD